MYSFLTFFLGSIIIGVIIALFIPKEESGLRALPMIIFPFLGLILGVSLSQCSPYEVEVKPVGELELECLSDNQSIDGSFNRSLFVGSGTLNGTMNYVIYYKKKEDGKERVKMAVIGYDKVDLEYIDDNETPIVEIFENFILKDNKHNIFWHTHKTKNREQLNDVI